jgi:hypothetical protein
MRSTRFLCLIAVFTALPLFARDTPTISSLSPNAVQAQGGAETFATLQGTHYLPLAGVSVIFSGPAGTFSVAPNTSTDTNMNVWIPQEVLLVPGNYSVVVRAVGAPDSNAATLYVAGNFIVLNIPSVILAEAINLTGGPAQFNVTATSFVSTQVTVDCSRKSGDFFPFDRTEVDCVASDDMGNAEKGSFTVSVADTTAPAIEVPRDLLAFGNADGAVVAYDVKASDAVDPDVKATCFPESGSFFRLGTATVDCSSADRFGNKNDVQFRVHVGSDEIPAMVIPSLVTAEAESLDGTFVKYDVSATDSKGSPADIKCDPPAGSLFPIGSTSVKCIAWGPSGASTTDFFNVNVVDTTAPALTLPREVSAQAPSIDGAVVTYDVSAKDTVDGATDVACFPASGSFFAPGQTVVNCSSSDKTRNIANGSFVVTVLPWVDDTIYAAPKGSNADQ